jgi:hypothetical protein
MAALSYARNRGVVVEALEARWSGSVRHRVALCHLVLGTMQVADKDKTWVRAAILDGYALFVGKEVKGQRDGRQDVQGPEGGLSGGPEVRRAVPAGAGDGCRAAVDSREVRELRTPAKSYT